MSAPLKWSTRTNCLRKRTPPRPSADICPQVGRVLKLKIAAPPIDGKANKEIESFLAKTLGLPKSAVAIAHG
ncbi:MAG: DUF167 domain-containing protein, partial [Clostridia bacterium]|nr:DUF167 domain-containing protein [Clostridia bacterium]